MYCPYCDVHEETKVIDSRLGNDNRVKRRRECVSCRARFTTYEHAELSLPWVIKRDGQRSTFYEEKLRGGMLRALEKRPVSAELFEQAFAQVMQRVRACGEKEITSAQIGQWVMDSLRHLDQVAYVRFASVYRNFQDVSAFDEEIKKLKEI